MTTTPAKIGPAQFAELSRPEQLDLLRQLSARQKVNLLLDLADGDELLADLPPQDLYLVITSYSIHYTKLYECQIREERAVRGDK